ncbi:MAG: polysaccharide biosynthesis C-terminal domain-containing protein [Bacteroidota bacterium]|jgi:O-antigen/teichoic acid export membrane protein|nr:polysaccharide biosynthesis C-terminal domain-containing protein [Cytophagales bacterium]MCE2956490.1 polysaccharide biosynthesis C-terminal domain-containing protein [Flammeovirgaceae bacterium]
MSKLKSLAGQTVLYGLGSMLPRFLNFLLVPLHTKSMFSTAQYGEITNLMAIVAVINVVYMFGMETAYFRYSNQPGADPKKVFNLAQTVVVMLSLLLSIAFIGFSSPIASALGQSAHREFIIWLVLVMLIDAVVAIPFAQLRLEKKAALFAVYKLANVSVLMGLNYYFLKINYTPSIGIGYVFLANLIANAFFIIFFLRTLLSWRPAWDASLSPEMIKYAYPVMLTGLAGMTNEFFSRTTLQYWLPQGFYGKMTTKEALGVFGACYKFAVLMNLGIQAFRYAAEPFFFSNANDKNSPALFAKVNHYFVVVGCIVLLGVSINLDIIKHFIGDEFWYGLNIVPILLLAYLFLGVYYNTSVWFKLTGKTHIGTIITLTGVAITILGNYWLIPVLGYLGSSWAALACYFSMTALCYWLGQKYYPIPYTVGKDLGYIIITMLIVYSVYQIKINDTFFASLFHIAVTIIFTSICILLARRDLVRKTA